MTLLRRLLGKKVYQIFLVVLLLATLLYQREVGIIAPIDTPQESAETTAGEVRVSRVIDGDTFEIEGGERVRLIGIDTPESVKPNAPVECFGRESSEYLKSLIEGKMVRLERDQTDRDRYARLLRYAYLDGTFLNEKIVREGYAESVAYKPDIREQELLDEAEVEAKREKKGRFSDAACQ